MVTRFPWIPMVASLIPLLPTCARLRICLTTFALTRRFTRVLVTGSLGCASSFQLFYWLPLLGKEISPARNSWCLQKFHALWSPAANCSQGRYPRAVSSHDSRRFAASLRASQAARRFSAELSLTLRRIASV